MIGKIVCFIIGLFVGAFFGLVGYGLLVANDDKNKK